LSLGPFGPDAHRPLDGPFVSLNLMPSHGSPVPLLSPDGPPDFRHPWHPLGPRKRTQRCMSWVRPELRTRTKCGL